MLAHYIFCKQKFKRGSNGKGRNLLTAAFNTILKYEKYTMHEKSPYSELFWSVFSPNAGKYVPE